MKDLKNILCRFCKQNFDGNWINFAHKHSYCFECWIENGGQYLVTFNMEACVFCGINIPEENLSLFSITFEKWGDKEKYYFHSKCYDQKIGVEINDFNYMNGMPVAVLPNNSFQNYYANMYPPSAKELDLKLDEEGSIEPTENNPQSLLDRFREYAKWKDNMK